MKDLFVLAGIILFCLSVIITVSYFEHWWTDRELNTCQKQGKLCYTETYRGAMGISHQRVIHYHPIERKIDDEETED